MDRRWEDRAACSGLPGEMFFEDVFLEDDDGVVKEIDRPALARARAVCAACPVRDQCFTAAMEEEAGSAQARRFGVRAGTTPGQRYSIWRRDVQQCDRCGERYDPLGIVAGEVVCSCGFFEEPPIPDEGDVWYPRHDNLLRRLTDHLLEKTSPGDKIPGPTRMLEVLGHRRKDDMPLVYRRLEDDGLIERGDGRGEYFRRAGRQALLSWRPPARLHAA
jgi:hypothetical protein